MNNYLRYIKEYILIKLSGLFYAIYDYLNYPDIHRVKTNPLMHFIWFGCGRIVVHANEIINNREYEAGDVLLKSYPQNIIVENICPCNAKCFFCPDARKSQGFTFNYDLFRNFFEPKAGQLFRMAKTITFGAFGEIFLIPQANLFLSHLNMQYPAQKKVITTNGIALKSEYADIMADGQYILKISLHASNNALHRKITNTNAFDQIISNIKYIIKKRQQTRSNIYINLVSIINILNIDDTLNFVSLAHRLGVDSIDFHYMVAFKEEDKKFSCIHEKEKTNEMLIKADSLAAEYGLRIFHPPLFNANDHSICKTLKATDSMDSANTTIANNSESVTLRQICSDPWKMMVISSEGWVNLCCSAKKHIDYIGEGSFYDVWNSANYIKARTALVEGFDSEWCKYCYLSNVKRINDIAAHQRKEN